MTYFQSVVHWFTCVETADTESRLCCLCWPQGSLFSVIKCSEPALSGVCLISSKSHCVSKEGTQGGEQVHRGWFCWPLQIWGIKRSEQSTQRKHGRVSPSPTLASPSISSPSLHSSPVLCSSSYRLASAQGFLLWTQMSPCSFWSRPSFPPRNCLPTLVFFESTVRIHPSCPEAWLLNL